MKFLKGAKISLGRRRHKKVAENIIVRIWPLERSEALFKLYQLQWRTEKVWFFTMWKTEIGQLSKKSILVPTGSSLLSFFMRSLHIMVQKTWLDAASIVVRRSGKIWTSSEQKLYLSKPFVFWHYKGIVRFAFCKMRFKLLLIFLIEIDSRKGSSSRPSSSKKPSSSYRPSSSYKPSSSKKPTSSKKPSCNFELKNP